MFFFLGSRRVPVVERSQGLPRYHVLLVIGIRINYNMSQGLPRNYVYLAVGSSLKEELESYYL